MRNRSRRGESTRWSPPSPPATGFEKNDEDAGWFKQGRQDDEPEWLNKDEVPAPRELYSGETSLDPSAWFDDDGDCLVDMPDWREARAQRLGQPAPAPPKPAKPRLSEGVAEAAAAAAAKMAKEQAAKAARAKAREAAGAEAWDGQADESAYFDYDIDDDLPDWRDARK